MRAPHILTVRRLLGGALLIALVALGLGTPQSLVHAQGGGNLLQNPGFEPPFTTRNSDATIQVANGWEPWYVTGGGSSAINARPEYLPAPASRIRSGSGAQEFNTFFATHTAGVYQRVTTVTPGTELRFSVWVWVWSSATFEDPNVSEDPNGVTVRVGIDPTGGTNAQSPNVVWSQGVEFYDEFRELSVVATASGPAVTVFVRSEVENFVGTNNIYLDDASLLPAGQVPPTAVPPTGVPTTPVPPSPTPFPIEPTQEGTRTPSPSPVFTVPPTFTPIGPQQPSATPVVPPSATPDLPDDFDSSIVYTVRAGDTVSGIAARFGSTIAAITEANGLSDPGLIYVGQTLVVPIRQGGGFQRPPTFTPAPIFPTAGPPPQFPTAAPPPVYPTAAPPPTSLSNYTIQRGDTLSGIAARYNTTAATLAQLNNIVNPNLIYAGQVIQVPGAVVQPPAPPPAQPIIHPVDIGDNLSRIALRYGVSIQAIMQANNIRNPNLIFVGQQLVIPR
jgi:LysM repeat protein